MRPFSRTQKTVMVSNRAPRLPKLRTERRTQNDNADIIIILPSYYFVFAVTADKNGCIIMYQFVADVKSFPAQSTTNAYKEVKIMIYTIDYYDGQNRRMVEFISARSYDSAKRKFMLHHLGEDVVVINSI